MPRTNKTPHPQRIDDKSFGEVCAACQIPRELEIKVRALLDQVVANATADIENAKSTPTYKADRLRLKRALVHLHRLRTTVEELGPCARFGLERARVELRPFDDKKAEALAVIRATLVATEGTLDRAVVEMEDLPEARGGPAPIVGRANAFRVLAAIWTDELKRQLTIGPESRFIDFCSRVFSRMGWTVFAFDGLEDAARDALLDPLLIPVRKP